MNLSFINALPPPTKQYKDEAVSDKRTVSPIIDLAKDTIW